MDHSAFIGITLFFVYCVFNSLFGIILTRTYARRMLVLFRRFYSWCPPASVPSRLLLLLDWLGIILLASRLNRA